MRAALEQFVTRELAAAVPSEVRALAAELARDRGAAAVLYYGSTLRTGELEGVLDCYVLTDGARGSPLRRAGLRLLWPDVSYHEVRVGERVLRAKVATMPLDTFEAAARGQLRDSTIWTRFVQPAAMVWQADSESAARTVAAVADAAVTAARFAALLGPASGAARDFWLALFRATYRLELRVEPPGREATILRHDPDRYARLLPIAWADAGIDAGEHGTVLAPVIAPALRRRFAREFARHARAGRALNAARLVKAAFTFEGAARYGLWKIQRHTGHTFELTPWRERHPVLASAGVMWRVLRSRRA